MHSLENEWNQLKKMLRKQREIEKRGNPFSHHFSITQSLFKGRVRYVHFFLKKKQNKNHFEINFKKVLELIEINS